MRRVHRTVATGALLAALGLGALLVSPAVAIDRSRALLYSPWFPAVLAGLYVLRPLLAWPITALSVLVGYRFGPAVGLAVALAGAVATSLLPYAVARYLRPESGVLGRATAGSERFFAATGDLRGVVAARLAPVPAEVISTAAGAGRVSLPAFALGTAVGELPWTVAAVLAGHSMRRVSAGAPPFEPGLVLAGLLAGGLLLAGPAYRHLHAGGTAR